ncbi:MAG: Crp/Fnr family transcriptional regulator [Nitrospira sp.]|nr:Crp/Fnr family transcriptional regulator [Nitrospira sp.]
MKDSDDARSRFLASVSKLQPISLRSFTHRKVVYASFLPGKTYVVRSGYVRLLAIGEGGNQFTRMLLGKGAIFGDLPFSPAMSMKEDSAMTSGATSIFEFHRQELEAAVRRDDAFCEALLEVYGRQLGILDRRVQWQFTVPLRRRVAMILLDLMEFGRSPCPHHGGFLMDIRMTHEELAELVGAARQVVTAILNDLRADGLLSYTRTYLCVCSPVALAQVIQSKENE